MHYFMIIVLALNNKKMLTLRSLTKTVTFGLCSSLGPHWEKSVIIIKNLILVLVIVQQKQ